MWHSDLYKFHAELPLSMFVHIHVKYLYHEQYVVRVYVCVCVCVRASMCRRYHDYDNEVCYC
jgi:hypothetical protein